MVPEERRDEQTCPECGARLSAGASRCDLCGGAVRPAEAAGAAGAEDQDAAPASVPEEAGAAQGVFCNQCGWANPADARFCSQCGTRLDERKAAAVVPEPAVPRAAAPSTPPEKPDPPDQRRVGWQVGIIVGASLLLVVALFLVTGVSERAFSTADAPVEGEAAAAPSAIEQHQNSPLPPELAAQVDSLEAVVEGLDGEARLAKQRELVGLLTGAGRFDRAAIVQEEVAEASGLIPDWKRAGDLFYDWMSSIQGNHQIEVAGHAIAAYEKVLAEQPDNLDVRTDMATAYLSSNDPMRGVEEVRRVLETDPEHIQARFNYGIMLSMINRVDSAVVQFERVQEIVGEESPYYQQAERVIEALAERPDETNPAETDPAGTNPGPAGS